MVLRKAILFLASGVILLSLNSCESPEVPPSVKVRSGPSFSLHGSGRLVAFAVYAPPSNAKVASPFNIMWMVPDPDVAPVVWEIECPNSFFKRVIVEGLVLSYGKVPGGCRQTVPPHEQQSAPLSPQTIYSFSAKTFYGRSTAFGNGYLYVDKSRVAQPTVVPDLCLAERNGRQVRVNCKTGDRYQEPTDLDKFVQEHGRAQ